MDRILAVVDEEVILYSEVKDQFEYMLANGQRDDGTLFCRVFEQLLVVLTKLDYAMLTIEVKH